MASQVIGEALREHAREHSERPFVKCGGEWQSFGAFDRRTDELAAGLAALGLEKGDRVAILMPNRIEILELYFALAKLCVVQVPLNIYLRGEFLRHQLSNSEPIAVVTDHPGLMSGASLLPEIPSLRTIVTIDDESDAAAAMLRDSGSHHWVRYADVTAADAGPPAVDVRPDDPMSILYTSGTTGLPKGCLLTHGYYSWVGRQMILVHQIEPSDRMFTALPMFHSAGRMMVVSAALQARAPLNVEPSFSARNFIRRASEEGATLAYGVGAMTFALMKTEPSEHDRAHQLRLIMMPPTSPEMQDKFRRRFGVTVFAETFGQTECVPVTNNPIFNTERRPGSGGKPVADLEVMLMDENDDPVPTGTPGEVVVRPKTKHAMFRGYWRNPEATAEAFRHLWFHTGDIGYFDDEGYFWFLDRKKDAIRRRGENVSSVELEATIGLHPDIEDVAVIGVASPSTEEDIAALLVLRDGVELTPAELFEFFGKHVPYYAVPRYVDFLNELPRNATGRLQKFKLRERGLGEGTVDFEALGFSITLSARRHTGR